MLVTTQKAIQGSKGKEVTLIGSSSGIKKKNNKKKKVQTSVVKITGGIAKNKRKAKVKDDKSKGKCFYYESKGY